PVRAVVGEGVDLTVQPREAKRFSFDLHGQKPALVDVHQRGYANEAFLSRSLHDFGAVTGISHPVRPAVESFVSIARTISCRTSSWESCSRTSPKNPKMTRRIASGNRMPRLSR